MSRVARDELFYHTDEALFESTGVRVAFTERTGGVSVAPYETLDVALHVGDDPHAVAENRHRVFSALGLSACEDALLSPKQVHGDEVFTYATAGEDTSPLSIGRDAVVCLVENTPVMLCFADCVPVVFVAPDGSFAVAHAGWRGALAGIAGRTARELIVRSGLEPGSFNVYIGAHIRSCCYETSDEVLEKFTAAYGSICDAGSSHLSLSAAIRCDLERAGISRSRICELEICTADTPERFYSYRFESGTCGRHAAIACRIG